MAETKVAYLELPSASGQAVLHPARILESASDRYTATPESTDLAFEVDQRLTVYYYDHREFLKRPAVVKSVDAGDGPAVIEFAYSGEACSAERRGEYRVSAVMADIFVGLEDEPTCEVVDISMGGCSVLAKGRYQIGQALEITLNHQGQAVVGQVVVRGSRSLGTDKTRYGLAAVSGAQPGYGFRKALRQMTMTLERTQLQRLSRC
ncbi:MAG: PilZ domain-containing protein [Planctomycetes bacterium]|nr:PilZ domain-containing protein [Planctomycetota bacterium]